MHGLTDRRVRRQRRFFFVSRDTVGQGRCRKVGSLEFASSFRVEVVETGLFHSPAPSHGLSACATLWRILLVRADSSRLVRSRVGRRSAARRTDFRGFTVGVEHVDAAALTSLTKFVGSFVKTAWGVVIPHIESAHPSGLPARGPPNMIHLVAEKMTVRWSYAREFLRFVKWGR